jgi:hypothetical protein
MNIFFLDRDPKRAAQMHIDKHVVKMILEYAQLLSTAHRILDGTLSVGKSESGRKKTSYVLMDNRDSILYAATHVNHPSAVWCRQTSMNYDWLYSLFVETCNEYTYRYGKIHLTDDKLRHVLSHRPKNIGKSEIWQDPTPAMPDTYKVAGDGVQSYRNYYVGDKRDMSRWTNREMPTWFADGINTLYGDACYMEHKPKLNRIISMPLSQYANV